MKKLKPFFIYILEDFQRLKLLSFSHFFAFTDFNSIFDLSILNLMFTAKNMLNPFMTEAVII